MTSIVVKSFYFLLSSNIKINPRVCLRALLSTNTNQQNEYEDEQQQQQQQHQEEHHEQSISSSPAAPETNKKILKVAVIGLPNAGKSTFVNNLINHRICPTSNKVHTTRNSNRAVYTVKDTQLIFYDTPGLVTKHEIKKFNLESTFSNAYKNSIKNSDAICVVHNTTNTYQAHELNSTTLKTLEMYSNIPSILILNKIDGLKSKRILLELAKKLTNETLSSIRKQRKFNKKLINNELKIEIINEEDKNKKLTGWSNFSEVFMVSSIMGDGLQDVLQYLLRNARKGEWEFPADVYTDQTPENIIVNSVRARLLDYLPQEIPYRLNSQLEYYNEDNNAIYTSVQVICPNSRIEKLICGIMDGKIKQITERVTSDLVETFGKTVSLTITTNSPKK